MAKNTPDRIIDTPETPSTGRASQYSAGATPTAVTLADHTHDGTANSGALLAAYARWSQAQTWEDAQTFPNTGLHILDTDGSHDLIIAPGSDLSADVTLSLVMTANRTLTLNGNATLNQDVSTAGSPAFLSLDVPAITAPAALTVTPAAGGGVNFVLSAGGFIDISSDGASSNLISTAYGVGFAPDFSGRMARGTKALPSATQVDDIIFSLGGRGYGNTGFTSNKASIQMRAAENWTNSVQGAHITFNTTAVGGVSRTEKVRIDSTGKIGAMTTIPTKDFSFGGDTARTIWVERGTVSNTAGNSLTVQAGGATVSATDKAGGDLNLVPGIPTGTGRANVRIKRFGRAVATSTADNTPVDGLVVAGEVNLTDAATSMFEISLGAGAMAGGCVIWTIRATDGTDMQAYTGITTFSVINKSGVYTKTVTSDAGNDAKAVSAGTLTAAFTLLDGTSKVTMQVTPAGSLTETTYQLAYTLLNNSPRAITIL